MQNLQTKFFERDFSVNLFYKYRLYNFVQLNLTNILHRLMPKNDKIFCLEQSFQCFVVHDKNSTFTKKHECDDE
jgi:hypothetical protein